MALACCVDLVVFIHDGACHILLGQHVAQVCIGDSQVWPAVAKPDSVLLAPTTLLRMSTDEAAYAVHLARVLLLQVGAKALTLPHSAFYSRYSDAGSWSHCPWPAFEA